MSSVAEQLRTAREAQNLSIHEVAEATKIKSDHVRALEEGNYDFFAAPVYIRGFVRTYGKLLKLDERDLMRELDLELALTKRFSEPPSLTGPAKGPLDWVLFRLSRINWSVVLPVGGLIIVLTVSIFSYRAWRHYKTSDPLAHLGPGIYQPEKPQPGETLPLPTGTPPHR